MVKQLLHKCNCAGKEHESSLIQKGRKASPPRLQCKSGLHHHSCLRFQTLTAFDPQILDRDCMLNISCDGGFSLATGWSAVLLGCMTQGCMYSCHSYSTAISAPK